MDPFHPDVLYAWVGSAAYVTQDGAFSWGRSSMPCAAGASIGGPGFRSAFAPGTPGIIYGLGYANRSQFLTTQKSVDGGATWKQLDLPFSTCCLIADPKTSGVLYASAQPINTNDPARFWKSIDGGVT